VFPDPPPDLPLGKDIRAEVVFTGYFLKIFVYRAFDNPRWAPMLVGRVRLVSTPVAVETKTDPWVIAVIIIGGLGFIVYAIWFSMRTRKNSTLKMLPKELTSVESGDEPNFDDFFSKIDADDKPANTAALASFAIPSEAPPKKEAPEPGPIQDPIVTSVPTEKT
jgi:hypothetical protein